MLKQGFDLRLGQTLSMTPQLQQAIRLLQLSSLELQTEIQQALEENPLLQLADDSEDSQPASEDSRPEPASEQKADSADSNEEAPDNTSDNTQLDKHSRRAEYGCRVGRRLRHPQQQ